MVMITVAQSTVNTVVRYMQIHVSLKTIKQMKWRSYFSSRRTILQTWKKITNKGYLKVNNCQFINNYTGHDGGAVATYWEIPIFTPQYLDLTMLTVMEVLHVQISTQQPQLKTAYLKIILQESGEEHYTIGQVS